MYLDFPNKIPISCYELHSIKFRNVEYVRELLIFPV